MKKLLLAATLTIATAIPAQAEQASCKQIGDIAEVVMQKRQEGALMSALMEVVSSVDLVRGMIIRAYEKPQFGTDEYRNREVVRFRNMYESVCYKQRGK